MEVAGTDPHSAKAIQKEFQPTVNQSVNVEEIQKMILDIQGDGRYASLNYSMVDKDGQPGLLISANEKSYIPPIVRPQITLDGSQYNNVLFSIGGRITFLNVGSYDSNCGMTSSSAPSMVFVPSTTIRFALAAIGSLLPRSSSIATRLMLTRAAAAWRRFIG